MKFSFYYLLLPILILFSICLKKIKLHFNPLIIQASFYYPNSTIFDSTGRTSIVVILYTQSNLLLFLPYYTIYTQNSFPKRINAKIERISNNQSSFPMIAYRIIGHLNVLTPIELRFDNKILPIKLNLRRVNPYNRQLVVCLGKMATDDQIISFVTSLEVFRKIGIEYMVVHIKSVEEKLMELLNFYVSYQMVGIRYSNILPTDFEYLTQENEIIMNQNECLYEFKENTMFFIFSDWNELILTKNMSPMNSILQLHDAHVKFMQRRGKINRSLSTHKILNIWADKISYKKKGLRKEINMLLKNKKIDFFEKSTLESNIKSNMVQSISEDVLFSVRIAEKDNTSNSYSNKFDYNISLRSLADEFEIFLELEPKIKIILEHFMGKKYFKKVDDPLNTSKMKCYKIKTEWTLTESKGMKIHSLISKKIHQNFLHQC